MNNETSLGDLVRRRCQELGFTQEELASRSSTDDEIVRQSDISRIERGQIQLPRRSRLERIATALDLPLGELLALSGWAGADQLRTPAESARQPGESSQDWEVSLEQLREAWRPYQDGASRFDHLRPVMLEPWKRCRDVGIDPDDIVFQPLSSPELASRISENASLIEVTHPHLERLSWTFSGKPHIIGLVDRDGWILDLVGTVEEYGGRAAGLAIGLNWSEQRVGNSGVGTSLATGQPVLVYGIEFEAHAYRPTVCFGVPIHRAGKVIGTIGIGVPQEYAEPERLNLAQICVRAIETQLASDGEFPVLDDTGSAGHHSQTDVQLTAEGDTAGNH